MFPGENRELLQAISSELERSRMTTVELEEARHTIQVRKDAVDGSSLTPIQFLATQLHTLQQYHSIVQDLKKVLPTVEDDQLVGVVTQGVREFQRVTGELNDSNTRASVS